MNLASIPLFSTCSEQELIQIQALLHTQSYPAGRTVYTHGEASDALYIVLSGSVVITHHIDHDVVTLAELETGFFFGEAGMLSEGKKHQSNAQAREEHTTIGMLTRTQFQNLTAEHPSISTKIVQGIAHTLSNRLMEDTSRIAIISAISKLVNDPDKINNLPLLGKEILRIILHTIPSHQAFIGLFKKHEGEKLHIIDSVGITPKQLPKELPIDSDPYLHKLYMEDGEVLLRKQKYAEAEKVFYAKQNLLARAITIEGDNIGVIALADKKQGDFTRQNAFMLHIIAGQISYALEEARLKLEKQSSEELERTYISM